MFKVWLLLLSDLKLGMCWTLRKTDLLKMAGCLHRCLQVSVLVKDKVEHLRFCSGCAVPLCQQALYLGHFLMRWEVIPRNRAVCTGVWVVPVLCCSELQKSSLVERGEGAISTEQPTLASCSTFSGQDEVLTGDVREFSTGSCHTVWALLFYGHFQQGLSSEIYVQASTYLNIINFAGRCQVPSPSQGLLHLCPAMSPRSSTLMIRQSATQNRESKTLVTALPRAWHGCWDCHLQ